MENSIIQISQLSVNDFLGLLEERMCSILATIKPSTEQNAKSIFTRKETCELLNVSETTLYHWNNQGILKNFKLGNRVYYSKDSVFEKLNSKL